MKKGVRFIFCIVMVPLRFKLSPIDTNEYLMRCYRVERRQGIRIETRGRGRPAKPY